MARRVEPARDGFTGSYHHRVDPKGRVAVPAALRRWAPQGTVVAPGTERRLMIWPPEAWAEQERRYRRTSETPAQERRFIRMLFGNTYPFELDGQGRLQLSPWQRQWTQMRDLAVFVGVGRGVELASEENWLERDGELDPATFDNLNDYINGHGESAPSATA